MLVYAMFFTHPFPITCNFDPQMQWSATPTGKKGCQPI